MRAPLIWQIIGDALVQIMAWCWMLDQTIAWCWMLDQIMAWCWMLDQIKAWCWMLDRVMVWCWMLDQVMVWCWMLDQVMVWCWMLDQIKGLSPVTRNLCCQSARGNRSGAVRYFPEAVRPRGNTAAPDRFPRADWQHKFLVTGLNPDYNMVTVRV